MRKHTVLSHFIDKYTRSYYTPGSTYESNDDGRILELQKNGFLGEEIETKKQPRGKTKDEYRETATPDNDTNPISNP